MEIWSLKGWYFIPLVMIPNIINYKNALRTTAELDCKWKRKWNLWRNKNVFCFRKLIFCVLFKPILYHKHIDVFFEKSERRCEHGRFLMALLTAKFGAYNP